MLAYLKAKNPHHYYKNSSGSTGRTPSKLLTGRQIKTQLPVLNTLIRKDDCSAEVQARDAEAKRKSKSYIDKRCRAKVRDVNVGDQIVLKQKKSTVNPPYDPRPYRVTKVQGTKLFIERDGKVKLDLWNYANLSMFLSLTLNKIGLPAGAE